MPFESCGTIGLNGSKLDGTLYVNNAELRPASASSVLAMTHTATTQTVFSASGMGVTGDFNFLPTAFGAVDLRAMRIDGHLNLSDGAGDSSAKLKISCPPVTTVQSDYPAILCLQDVVAAKLVIAGKIDVDVADLGDKLRQIVDKKGVVRARQLELSWLPGWRLVECLCATPTGHTIITILVSKHDARLLNTDANAFLPIISKSRINFNDIATVKSYLTFFSAHVWGPHGGFHIIEPSNPVYEQIPHHLRSAIQQIEVVP